MEIYKAPTLRLKALNKHTHIMYIEMENAIQKNKYVSIDKCSSIIMQKMHTNTHTYARTHAHTHTVQTVYKMGQIAQILPIFASQRVDSAGTRA